MTLESDGSGFKPHRCHLSIVWPKASHLNTGSLCLLFGSGQFSRSVVSDSVTPWIAAHQASLSITNFWSSLKLMSIELVMPSSHLILCHHLLLRPPIPPSIGSFPTSQLFAKKMIITSLPHWMAHCGCQEIICIKCSSNIVPNKQPMFLFLLNK